MNAKWLKSQATSAKRTATGLRDLAKSAGISPEDSGIMLAAARAVDALAIKRGTEAKQAKRKEDEMVAFYAKAEKEARAKIFADWPTDSVLDKVTLVVLNKMGVSLSHLIGDYPDQPLRILNNYFDSAVSDICREAASRSWYKKITVTEAMCALAREWEAAKCSRVTIGLVASLTNPIAKAA